MASPLRSLPLRSLGSVQQLVDCSRVDCSNTSVATLATAADLVPTAIRDLDSSGNTVTLGALVQSAQVADFAGFTLGDLKEYGNTTIGDLIAALPSDSTYTLGDLLIGLIPVQDFPWQDINLNTIADLRAAAATAGAGGSAGALVHFTVDLTVAAPAPYTLASLATVALASGYQLQPGSALLVRGGVNTPLADPSNLANPAFAINIQNGDQLVFDAIAGLDLTNSNTSVTVTALNVLSRTTVFGTSVAGEWEEPNNSIASAVLINPDTIYLPHIASPSDVDMFKVSVAEGQTMSAIMSNLPADFDLVLYGPPAPALAGRTPERILVPIQDETAGLKNDGTATPANPANDIALSNAAVYAVGQRRDTGDERIDTGRLHAGIYYLSVTGFNGAASTKPYALRVTMESSGIVIPPCSTWSFTGDSLSRGSLPADVAYTGANTIFVVNRERLFGKFPGQASSVMTALDAFVNSTNLNATMGVKAVVVPIDGDANVHAAFLAWEAGSNRCDPLKARDVSSAISTLLDGITAAHPGIQNVVMVGGDDLIPFGRVADTTRLANERDFAQELTGNNELVASARGGWMLTDDVYVDRSPVQVGTGELYVPNLTIGRLVESPSEIVGALNDFVTNAGNLDAKTALSVGYDFLSDGATEVKAALEANGFTTQANSANLIGDTWSAQDLKNALLGLNGRSVPSIAAVNAHFDDHRALPADQNLSPSPTNLFTTADLGTTRTLARSLLFSVGCHSGYSVADSTDSSRGSDWAQSFAGQGAVWLGNTGFGYGDTTAVAASEKLMANFAVKLNGSYTVGQALLLAKQRYIGDLGQVVTGYDMKVSQEMTYYGLPMYRLRAIASPVAAVASPAPVVTDPRVGLPSASLLVATPVNNTAGSLPGTLERRTEQRGTYYTVDGGVLTVQNRPIQPLTTRDVTRVDPVTGVSLGTATGVLVTQLVSQDVLGVNPAVYRPIVDSKAESEPATVESVFPAGPASIGNSIDLVNISGQTKSIARQSAVIVPGQFRADTTGVTGTQRLFTTIGGQVFYAPNGNADTLAPTIRQTSAGASSGGATITVQTDDNGVESNVKRVYVLAKLPSTGTASVAWFGTDLVRTAPGMWAGTVAVPANTSAIDYIVQAVDGSGNVGVSSNKGVLYATVSNSVVALLAPTVAISPSVPVSGWINGPVTVTATDPQSAAMSYSIDGGPAVNYVSPFVLSGTGAHTVSVVNTAGLVANVQVPIDVTAPTANVTTPAPNAVYTQAQLVKASYVCGDGQSGVSTCVGPVANGAPIDTSSPGVHTFVVTTSDLAGNSASSMVSYTVAPVVVADTAPPVVVCGAVPSGWSKVDVSISCTASDAGSGLANPADAAFVLSTSVAAGTATSAATTASRVITDVAGNSITVGPFVGIKVDKANPVIGVTSPVANATFVKGASVSAAYTCSDVGSGIGSCVGTVAVGALVDTATLGTKSFVVNAVDAVGNTATTTVTYTVVAPANVAPVVLANMGVPGLADIGFQSNAVAITGSFTDPDGSGPYTSWVQWTAGGSFTPFVLNSSSQFIAAYVYGSAGTRQVTVKVCDKLGACGTSAITVRTAVTQKITPTRCVVDRGSSVSPRYQARFGYVNPAPFAIFVPVSLAGDNYFTTGAAGRGQPEVFASGTKANAFAVDFATGTQSWKLNGVTASASSTSPRC